LNYSIKKFNEKEFEHKLLDLLNNQIYKNNAIIISEKMKAESNIDKLYDMIIK